MEEKITAREALQATVEILSDINIPVLLIEQVGIPIAQAIQNLRAIINATDDPEEPEEKPKEGDGDV